MKKNDILQHFGVPGMKWGVRRKPTSSEDYRTARGLKRKKIRELSNEDLKKLTSRLDLERRYKDLNPSAVKRGKKAVSNVITGLGTMVGVAGTVGSLAAIGKKVYDFYKGKGV